MPRDPAGRAATLDDGAELGGDGDGALMAHRARGLAASFLSDWLASRLDRLEAVLATRDWLAAGRFTAADLIMVDVLRVPEVRALGACPATDAYVARVTARPAFARAPADQLAHFAAADTARAATQWAPPRREDPMEVDTVFLSIHARDVAAQGDWWTTLLDQPDGARTTVSLRVADLDAEVARLRAAGLDVADPATGPGFDSLVLTTFEDPEANPVALLHGG